ncbi:type 4b pilus protein PilO2 [Paraburkholderia sp. UCT31]|uniref:type 4b pilus protein PilO2 n=1 Tax=Paraburkholderia sp. UCT31 TaxID=2615209 RepID=UPI0016550D5F|nr:type 4b pilus protein PilO2 [Paraburkholderia sp. UCT31]MBC8737285.1 type 4b pilus protein PilO2 [Paraburkholderia sp. UCT31]
MDFHVFEAEGLSLVSGLDWVALPGLQKASVERLSQGKDLGAARYVEFASEDETVVGFLPAIRLPDVPGKVYSLTALFAGVDGIAKNAVYVFERGDSATLCAIKDGLPMVGFDGHGPVGDIVSAAQLFISMVGGAVTVYGNSAAFPDSVALGMDRLLADAKSVKRAQLKTIADNQLRLGALVVFLIAGAIAANWGYSLHKKHKAEQEALARQVVDIEKLYTDSVTTQLHQSLPLNATVKTIKAWLAEVAVDNNGWTLTQVDCTRDGCTFTWTSVDGTNATFQPPEGVAIVYSPTGDKITYSLPPKSPLTPGIATKDVVSKASFLREHLGALQAYKSLDIAYTVTDPVPYAIPPGATGTPARLISEGSIEVSGPWWATDALAALPQATAFDSLTMQLSDTTITFKVKAKYYVN